MGYRALLAPDTSTVTLPGATERLQQSRQRMRDQMLALKASSAQAQATRQRSDQSSALLATLTALPVLGPLIHSAVSWWADHPLHAVADLFIRSNASATGPIKQPLTQRHPWALLLGAVAVGALLMWARPWRFGLLRRAVYAGVVPQMINSLLSRVSSDGLLDIVKSALGRPLANPSPPPATGPPAGNEGTTRNSTLH